MSQSTWHLEPNQAGGWLYTCIICLFYTPFIGEDRSTILFAIFGCGGTILLGNCGRWVIGSLFFLDQIYAGCWLVLHIIVDWFATWRAGCLDLDISLEYPYSESSKHISGSTINHQPSTKILLIANGFQLFHLLNLDFHKSQYFHWWGKHLQTEHTVVSPITTQSNEQELCR